ncbi:MAG: molybdopterin cofactor-binding domain-containing protein, partial [Planctomycetota bacterium]
ELMVAGSRPSAYANVRVGVSKDGRLNAWDSHSFGTSGDGGGGGGLRLPYVFEKMPYRQVHTAIRTNTGPARAWRAPSHPQLCLITMSALEDAAAALQIDPLEFFRKNLDLTGMPEVYEEELGIAAKLMGWKERWHPRGEAAGSKGPRRSGLGLSIHTWGGRGHDSNCRTTLYADGRVDVACATQDLGTGARTVLAVVTAETLGIPVEKVNVLIGDSMLPPSGASGGSTTTGGIATSSRTAAVDAINQLIAKVAPELDAAPEQCVVTDGRIQVEGAKERSMSYQEACGLIGAEPIVGNGRTDPDLMTGGVGGVQMAEVAVDIETGVVEMVKLVAVQDCGTIVNLQTTESQVMGACIMGISTALFEERIMDPITGDCLNPHLSHYRLAGIGDVGEIKVHMMQTEGHHGRGVIGVGEPPVISPVAAISNAVANAIGVRVGRVPLTPAAVLTALGGVR